MLLLYYLLCLVLLTGSPNEEPKVNPEMHWLLSPMLQKMAIEREILDPRECRYVLARSEDFASDLKFLRQRNKELQGAPPLCDAARLPDRGSVSVLTAFNRSYRQHLEARLSIEVVHCWELEQAIQETDRLYQVWDHIRDAGCGYYYVTVRREALKWLLNNLGPEAYYNGNFPPHIPIWRFERMD